jgi:hypothetical protein
VKFGEWKRASFPTPNDSFQNTEDWWLKARKTAPKEIQRYFDTVTILVHWRIWKERIGRIFQQEFNMVGTVVELIIEDLCSWRTAGCVTII